MVGFLVRRSLSFWTDVELSVFHNVQQIYIAFFFHWGDLAGVRAENGGSLEQTNPYHLQFFSSSSLRISYHRVGGWMVAKYRIAVTGPVARFARQIASQGYIVAAPSSYHEFTGPEPLAYDGPGTDAGNEWKITKKVEAYDEDARLAVDALLELKTCNGRVGATGTFESHLISSNRQQSFDSTVPNSHFSLICS